MKIKEMTATFGNLHKATLRPGSGFTLLSAPNESGKSTWAAFLRAMLYGFPARDRNKEGYIAEKNRYQPWSGAPMEGTLTLTWQGRDITLYRGPKGSTPWGTFTAVYTATGEAVPGLTAETCGGTLLGVSREGFERTAFVGQGEAAPSPRLPFFPSFPGGGASPPSRLRGKTPLSCPPVAIMPWEAVEL